MVGLLLQGCQTPTPELTPTPLERVQVHGQARSGQQVAENSQQQLAVGKAPRPKPRPKPAQPRLARQTLRVGPPPVQPLTVVDFAPTTQTQTDEENLLQVTTELSRDSLSTRQGQTLYALVEIGPKAGHGGGGGSTQIALVLDVSGSMGSTGVGLASAAASQIFAQAGANDRTWLIAFANEARVLLEGSGRRPGPDEIMRLLTGADVGGGTQLDAGVDTALVAMQTAEPGRGARHLILVTDGMTDAGAAHQACQRAAQQGITVSCVGIERYDASLLQSIAQEGHGEFYAITSPEQLPNILAKDASTVRDLFMRDLRLSTQLAPGVRLRRAFQANQVRQLDTQKSGGATVISVGNLRRNQTARVLLELEVDPGQNPVQSLARMSVLARNPDHTHRSAQPLQDLTVPTYTGKTPQDNRYVRKTLERVFSTMKPP